MTYALIILIAAVLIIAAYKLGTFNGAYDESLRDDNGRICDKPSNFALEEIRYRTAGNNSPIVLSRDEFLHLGGEYGFRTVFGDDVRLETLHRVTLQETK